MGADYETFAVAVAGGDLCVGRWGSGPRVVLGVHGLTRTHVEFHALADQLGPEYTVLAPDLRGRGASRDVGSPYGTSAHADDVAVVLDAADASSASLIGFSVGAFVALVAAQRNPGRVRNIVLVDGGLPPEPPTNVGEDVVDGAIAPLLDRLSRTFPSTEAYLASWRDHPGFASDWNAYMEELFTYELIGTSPELRSGIREDAVLADHESYTTDCEAANAIERVAHPTVFLRAERGMLDEVPPLYPAARVDSWRRRVPLLRDRLVAGVNHHTILLSPRGAQAVAAVLREDRGTAASGGTP